MSCSCVADVIWLSPDTGEREDQLQTAALNKLSNAEPQQDHHDPKQDHHDPRQDHQDSEQDRNELKQAIQEATEQGEPRSCRQASAAAAVGRAP